MYIAHGLDRFDLAKRVALDRGIIDDRQVDVYNVTQLVNCKLTQANRARVILKVGPFMRLGKAKVFWLHGVPLVVLQGQLRVALDLVQRPQSGRDLGGRPMEFSPAAARSNRRGADS